MSRSALRPSTTRSSAPRATAARRAARTALALLVAPLLATGLAAPARALQDAAGNALGYLGGRPGQDGGAQDAPAAGELPPVEAPPELSAVEVEKVKRAVKKLRNDSDKHRHAAEEEVVAFGRGALPFLLDAASTDHASMQDALTHCFAALVDARDRELVAAQLAGERPLQRRLGARAAGKLALPALLDTLPPLLEDADEGVRLEAALALLAHGREEGLGVATLAFGGPAHDRVLAALPGAAGAGNHTQVAALLAIDPKREKRDPEGAAKERLAAVQILHAIGDPAAVDLLVGALDDKHNVVQRQAIDALRDLLEDKEPLEASSIFQQINEVKRLKEVAATRC